MNDRIQLLLADEGNRRALRSLLEEQYTPITAESFTEADLYIVDERSFSRHREAVASRKQGETPVFCPVMLICREGTPVVVDHSELLNRGSPILVDEVLHAPIDKQTLFRRITNLLLRRQHTKELQERTARLEQFAKTLRHELRNPLNVLGLSLEKARMDGRPEDFERCQRAVDRMERMLEETLLIIEEGELTVETEPVDVASVADQCWDIITEDDAHLTVRSEQLISADRERFKQLLENLFRNAVEHNDDEVRVEIGDMDQGVYVEDDGVGIPADDRERVFEEGYTTRKSGSGLGLAVVETVADAHGWTVQLRAGSAGGARFEFTDLETTSRQST